MLKSSIPSFATSKTQSDVAANILNDASFHFSEAEAKYLSLFDALTGLPNRRAIEERLERKLATAKRRGKCGALLFIDLDHFKSINDAFGHHVGDGFLVQVAERLSRVLREEDMAARMGGDEFLILLPELGDDMKAACNFAQTVAEKVIQTLGRAYLVEGHVLNVGASIGITMFPENQKGTERILQEADIAMYRGKGARGKVHFFDQSRHECVNARLEGAKILQEGLKQNQFVLHYQPQLDSDGHILGLEACLKWRDSANTHPDLSVLISSEENSQQLLSLAIWMLSTLCRDLKRWSELEIDFGYIAIDAFPAFFLQADFVEQVVHLIDAEAIDPRRLVFELKETAIFGQYEESLEKMNALRSKGIRFALESFGSGPSSLDGLQKLPINFLKIDKGFTSDLAWRSPNGILVKTILGMAQAMELEVVAEGVVSAVQLEMLGKMGCRFAQGDYLSVALSEPEVRASLCSRNRFRRF